MNILKEYFNKISPLNDASFDEMKQHFKEVKLKKNDFFVKEGQYASTIGLLTDGVVRAFFLNKEGKEYNKQFFTQPSIIGAYTSLITKQANKISQQALTDCTILVADFKEIETLYSKYHDIERLGRKVAEFYFLEKEKKEIEMALLDADKRYLILREAFPGLESLIPQYHIASYLGISATQLSRIRKKLVQA